MTLPLHISVLIYLLHIKKERKTSIFNLDTYQILQNILLAFRHKYRCILQKKKKTLYIKTFKMALIAAKIRRIFSC